jgi:L-histidine N-alpha-methyltransferase
MDAPRVSVAADPDFRRDVLAGLASPIRAIPARWLYDRRGSELFEAITRLPEYYLTRTETALLERRCPDVARIAGPGQAVVEFGSGASVKTRILLAAAAPSAYVPVDISGDFLRDAAASLAEDFPGLPVHPIEADFTRPIELPAAVASLARRSATSSRPPESTCFGSCAGRWAPAPGCSSASTGSRTRPSC